MSKSSVSVFGWIARRGEGLERVIVWVRVVGMVSLDVVNVVEMRCTSFVDHIVFGEV